ncbi:ATP-binding protein [Falsiroseomonas sp.]|uniref:ATP-binding protein n=1 Tax=Falsiroseomonas sp. TaxID=2870721 RepID=UPI003565142F
MAPHRVSIAILALVLLFLAALVGMRADSLREDRAAALLRAESDLWNLSRVAEQYAQRVFETAELVSAQAAARVAELGGTEALRGSVAAHHWLRDLSVRSAGDYLTVIDARGRPVLSSYDHPVADVDLSDRRWFRAHAEFGDETHVGEALHSRITDEILFTYSRILRTPDGAFDGVVQLAVRTGFFQQIFAFGPFASRATMGLFDSEGRILAYTGLTPEQLDLSLSGTPLLARAAAQAEGMLRTVLPFAEGERIVAFRRLADWPVLVTASLPVEAAVAPWRRAVRWSVEVIGSVTLGLLLLAALAILLANREARARTELAGANRALREAAVGLEARVAARTRDLAASETRFRVLFDSTFQLMALLDQQGVVLEANETALDFLGLTRTQAVGQGLAELPCWPDGKTRAGLAVAIAAAGQGLTRRSEIVARAADGRLAPLEVSLRPVRDAGGRISWLLAEAHDLTELKAAEAKLREAQKVEALGQLTGGVAHDFNNLLMVVLGNLGLLRKRLPPDPRLVRLLDGAQQGAERGAALTQRMLAFARRQELRPAAVDLAQLVRGVTPLLERSAGPTVRIEADLREDLPPALVDANQLELALLNLVVNARDAMAEGGRVVITAAAAEAPSPEAPPELLPGRYLRLALSDTGVGMDAATLARATEPFFTTKGVGHGSGLGLSMVQGLAQQSGGGLTLRSRPGEGTTAEVWLPRAGAESPQPSGPMAEQAPSLGPPRRVLVVDDDPLVAAGTAMMLEDLGHSTLVATSAEDALLQLDRDPMVDLVLTDHAMPGLTGLELAERLRVERPAMPVALATGYAELPPSATSWLPRLNKPYRQEELARLVRRLTRVEVA